MERMRQRSIQKPLSPTEAWERIQNVSRGISHSSRLRLTSVSEVSDLLRDHKAQGKRKRYRDFQIETLRRCGPLFVVACAIGMGQAQIANMNTADRRALLNIVVGARSSTDFLPLKDLVPLSLKELPQRPPERGPGEYSRFKMASLDRISLLFPPYLCDAVNESMVRVWEAAKCPGLPATESIKTEITWTNNYDGLMFLDVGFAQDIASALFPQVSSTTVSSCCHNYTLKGASISSIISLLGRSVLSAIDKSILREWEKVNGQLDTTDCVEMIFREEGSRHAILKLRLGWKPCVEIVNSLYG